MPASCPHREPGPGFSVQVYQWQANEEHSQFGAVSFAEMLPRPENRVTLDREQRDAWGIPVLRIDCTHSDEELMRAREQIAALRDLAELAGVTLTGISKAAEPPGFANHETGTARMGQRARELGARPSQPMLGSARALPDRWCLLPLAGQLRIPP